MLEQRNEHSTDQLADRMKTVAFIPVRGGSKSIPGKNIKLLGGKPLLHWTLEAASNSETIDTIYVSSDSEEILACARAFGNPKVHCVVRPSEFATDTASTESAMLHFAENHEFEHIVLIQATSPLTTSDDLDGAIHHMRNVKADSLLSGTHEFRFRWRRLNSDLVEADNYVPVTRPRRQDWDGELVENGAFYICSRKGLLESRCRLNGKVAFWTMPGHTAVEIDTPDDWKIFETLAAKRWQRTNFGSIRLLVTDVDGVLTDGGMYYGPDGEALKKFNTRDGMGLAHFRKAGGTVAIVTGENSTAVAARAKKLNIDELHLGIAEKLPVVRALAEKYRLSMDQVGYIGDDVNDLPAMAEVGLVACPSDAHPSVRAIAHLVCRAKGGEGCVREFVDIVLAQHDDSVLR